MYAAIKLRLCQTKDTVSGIRVHAARMIQDVAKGNGDLADCLFQLAHLDPDIIYPVEAVLSAASKCFHLVPLWPLIFQHRTLTFQSAILQLEEQIMKTEPHQVALVPHLVFLRLSHPLFLAMLTGAQSEAEQAGVASQRCGAFIFSGHL